MADETYVDEAENNQATVPEEEGTSGMEYQDTYEEAIYEYDYAADESSEEEPVDDRVYVGVSSFGEFKSGLNLLKKDKKPFTLYVIMLAYFLIIVFLASFRVVSNLVAAIMVAPVLIVVLIAYFKYGGRDKGDE